ncbi:class I SAM-dependent methyltransferase [Streptomyces sp. NPDC050658]|uniref:class I SAM-dependent methyltransferase n=1 Tax=unclassified Streptomyces TaxID=2593676 RepID=UPI003449F1AB
MAQQTDAPSQPPAEEPYFDDLAELYERFIQVIDGDESPVRRWLEEQLRDGSRAVDVGCGGGRNCVLLSSRYKEVLGVDIAEKMLDIARAERARAGIRYEHRGVFGLSAERDGTYDMVLSVNSVFHMGPVDEVLARLRSLVAPGGRLVVVDVVLDEDWDTSVAGWQLPYAFGTARMVYRVSGDSAAAADAIRLMLHPRWLEMSAGNLPLARSAFHRAYSAALPGVVVRDDVNPTLCAAVWDAPSA